MQKKINSHQKYSISSIKTSKTKDFIFLLARNIKIRTDNPKENQKNDLSQFQTAYPMSSTSSKVWLI